MKKGNASKESEKILETKNNCIIQGSIERVLVQNDKIGIFTLVSFEKSPNGKQLRHYVNIKVFGNVKEELELTTGDKVTVQGYVASEKNEYNGTTRYNTYVVATIENINETNF